jgi:hypothetical protein
VRTCFRRPSPALVISLIALFVAMGGSGYAAVKLNGKNIKNKSIAGKKLKNKTITGGKVKNNTLGGTQINEGALGQVPSAAKATSATSATSATTATNLASRKTAVKGPVAATPGANQAAALAAAPEVPLFSSGPFTVYGKCITDTGASQTSAMAFVKTTEGNSILSGIISLGGSPDYLQPSTAESTRIINSATATNNAGAANAGFFATAMVRSPSGVVLQTMTQVAAKRGNPPAGSGPYGAGDACLFSGDLERVN